MEGTLWKPSEQRVKNSQMYAFLQSVKKEYQEISGYSDLHRYSVENPRDFWRKLIEFYPLKYEGSQKPVCTDLSFETYGWFPNVKLNFAENMLSLGEDDQVALNFVHESGLGNKLKYGELRKTVGRLQNALKPILEKGDVLAAYMPNIPETVVSMLGATSLGATFTSTSSDFGVEGVIDRFGQSKPKVMVAASHYQYNGKTFDLRDRIKEVAESLPGLEKILIVDFLGLDPDISEIPKATLWQDFLSDKEDLTFKRVPFSDPLYIMYSSGTTGKPKCIVHSVGGTLLQHVKELGLHTNLTSDKNIFYFTTCGWMMWNWLVSSLFFGATVTLYDGSPGFPSLEEFVGIIDREGINIFGTSPKFLRALEDKEVPLSSKFETLESLLSTGAPLLPEQFDFIYEKIKSDLQVSSICGGTDIIGCFMLGNPILPVVRGEIQCLGLGMDVASFDDNGNPAFDQEGELVCRKSFPSRPIYFLNDPEGKRFHSAYFERFPGVWHHGDFITLTKRGTVKVFGRSDATLNPGGVRIGTAEIYRQTEPISYLEDSLCVGKPDDGDVKVVLFVKMKEGEKLTEERIKEIQKTVKENTTPRHMPREVHAVSDIPYTRSGKKMELAITRILQSKPLNNVEAVANPECLSEYEKFI